MTFAKRVDFLGSAHHALTVTTPAHHSDLEKTGDTGLFVRATGRINGVGLYEYSNGHETWNELRLPEYVFSPETLHAWEMMPITNDHPDKFITPDNWGRLVEGHLGSRVEQDDKWTRADMLFHGIALLADIRAGKRELSCGYGTELIPANHQLIHELAKTVSGLVPAAAEGEDGTYHGKPFRWLQTKYQPNHVAVVDQARGGPKCRIDGAAWSVRAVETNEDDMNEEILGQLMAAIEAKLPEAIKATLMQLGIQPPGAAPPPAAPAPDATVAPPAAPPVRQQPQMNSIDSLKGIVDTIASQMKTLTDRAKAEDDLASARKREEVIDMAKSVLPGFDADTPTIDIMRQVVTALAPHNTDAVKTANDEYVRASYDTAVSFHRAPKDSHADNLRSHIASGRTAGNTHTMDSGWTKQVIYAALGAGESSH